MAYKVEIGIYKIESETKPERFYIGSSCLIRRRWAQHLKELREGKHHSPQLQRHYDKYGKDDLTFSIILICDEDELIPIEQSYITNLKPYFNCSEVAGSRKGVKASAETRKLLSTQRKGRKMKTSVKGYKYTEEQSQRRSEQQMGEKNHQFGKTWNEERRQKHIDRLTGHTASEETKKKMRDTWARKKEEGYVYKAPPKTPESIAKVAAFHTGRKRSDETRRRISEALLRSNKNKRNNGS